MLDFRIATFLTLCETRSYTQTARLLNITQPSVTQHIKHLQKKYQCVLFQYEAKTLRLTPQGEYLRAHATDMTRRNAKIISDLQRMGQETQSLRMGCPAELGEAVITRITAELMQSGVGKISLVIRDTPELLEMLGNSELDLVLTDACAHDCRFQAEPVGTVRFAVYAGQGLAENDAETCPDCRLEDLLTESLVLQNPGTSARTLLEDCLKRHGVLPESFADRITAGSEACLRELTASGMGIAFAYSSSMQDIVEQGRVTEIAIPDFQEKRTLIFQYQTDNLEQERFPALFETFRAFWDHEDLDLN